LYKIKSRKYKRICMAYIHTPVWSNLLTINFFPLNTRWQSINKKVTIIIITKRKTWHWYKQANDEDIFVAYKSIIITVERKYVILQEINTFIRLTMTLRVDNIFLSSVRFCFIIAFVPNSISTTFSKLNRSCRDHSDEKKLHIYIKNRNPTDINFYCCYCQHDHHHFLFVE
jgi:hypothetical protein